MNRKIVIGRVVVVLKRMNLGIVLMSLSICSMKMMGISVIWLGMKSLEMNSSRSFRCYFDCLCVIM